MIKFFKESEEDQYTIIVGCGRLGANIANALSDKGGNVLVIDKNKDAFRRLSSGFGGLTIVGDGTDLDTLEEAQVENAAVVVAVSNNDNVNIMVSQIARNMYHTKRVIARLFDPEKKCVFRTDGIHVICPAALSAQEIGQLLENNENE